MLHFYGHNGLQAERAQNRRREMALLLEISELAQKGNSEALEACSAQLAEVRRRDAEVVAKIGHAKMMMRLRGRARQEKV